MGGRGDPNSGRGGTNRHVAPVGNSDRNFGGSQMQQLGVNTVITLEETVETQIIQLNEFEQKWLLRKVTLKRNGWK